MLMVCSEQPKVGRYAFELKLLALPLCSRHFRLFLCSTLVVSIRPVARPVSAPLHPNLPDAMAGSSFHAGVERFPKRILKNEERGRREREGGGDEMRLLQAKKK